MNKFVNHKAMNRLKTFSIKRSILEKLMKQLESILKTTLYIPQLIFIEMYLLVILA